MNLRINCNTIHRLIIKKSEFITELYRAFSLEEVQSIIKDAHKRHPKSTHICTAYRIKDIERSNDDGEPGGTAGLPMLEVLRKQNIVDVCALVIRYYGGIQLGAGGLTRAYNNSIVSALETIQLNPLIQIHEFTLRFPLSFADIILNRTKDKIIIKKAFTEDVTLILQSEDDLFLDELKELTRGQIEVISMQNKEIEKNV